MRARSTGMPGVVKVVVKKNFVGVVAEKPWQAIQAANKLKVDVDGGQGSRRSRTTSTITCATRSRRATRSWSTRRTSTKRSRGRPRSSRRRITTRIKCTDRSAARALSPTCKRQGDHLVGHAGRLSAEEHAGDGARPAAGERPRDLQAGLRLLRHQRRRHRLLRCGAAVAGGREAGASAAHAQGRDGVGELRLRLRDRRARGPERRRHRSPRGITSRGRRASAAGPATMRPATS